MQPTARRHHASRRRRVRTVTALAVGLASAVALAACTKAPAPVGRTEITLWSHGGTPAERTALASIVDGFNRSQPRVHASIETVQEGDYNDRLTAAAASGTVLPDVIDVDGPLIASYAARAMPTACEAMPMRPASSTPIAIEKPLPSSPSRFSLGQT